MTQPEEVLLTKSQLADIEEDARDPLLKDTRYLHLLGSGPISIYRVSPVAELILIKGNEHTGMLHINARHGFHSPRNWQVHSVAGEAPTVRLDDPSRFRRIQVPILNYVAIAEAVYLQGNLDAAGNKRPEVFDKYVGDYTSPDGVVERHVLLLYRGTKIIHTLFPQKSTNNQKQLRGFPFKRGLVSFEEHLGASATDFIIPYSDDSGQTKYALMIRFNTALKTQEILLWVYSESGEREQFVLLDSRPHDSFNASVKMNALFQLQHADLRHYEQAIKDTESGKIKRLPDLP